MRHLKGCYSSHFFRHTYYLQWLTETFKTLPRACLRALVLHAPTRSRLPFITRIFRCTVALELHVLVLAAKSFHDACLQTLPANTNPTESLACALSKSRPGGPRPASRRCFNAPQSVEEKKEVRVRVIVLGLHRDQERFRVFSVSVITVQDESNPSSTLRPSCDAAGSFSRGPPKTTTSGRTPSDERNIWLHHRHRAAASGFRTRKCSGQALPKMSLEDECNCVEQAAIASSVPVIVRRRLEKFTDGRKPGRRLVFYSKTSLSGSSWSDKALEGTSTFSACLR
ncbi:hypothetical protein HPB51_022525 [Rhipicephalus microplus]|uniref:Uncharacterized protein n=1 Tax=Rhipicephalus microplus TaxID=6941 RepID=A0A9J6EBV8_RHIMP|nr:hypothetical protein HPB51_022525 [Rhipicephalus microplus]